MLPKRIKTKVMVFGTFDIVHPGHRDFFKQARDLAKHVLLIVSIARDNNVFRIKKHWPRNKQDHRLAVVADLPEVDKAVLGDEENYLLHIIAERPDIIALGYDQHAYTESLEGDLVAAKLETEIIRLKPFQPEKFKTSLLL